MFLVLVMALGYNLQEPKSTLLRLESLLIEQVCRSLSHD